MTIVKRPIVVDIDDDDATVFADRFTPANAQTLPSSVLETEHEGLMEAQRHNLQRIKIVDHAFFAKHPERWEYIRELLPGEFGVALEPPAVRKRWVVKVTAFRDFDKRVMLRIREGVLLNVAP